MNEINFLKNIPENKKPRRKKMRIIFYPLIFALIAGAVFSFQVLLSNESITDAFKTFSLFTGNGLSFSSSKPLDGQAEDRINVLLLGMGGEGHPGPYLTDTIIIASIKPSTNEVSLLSIPRDLSIPIPQEGWRKINNVNHFGEMAEKGSGGAYTSTILSETFSIPIHYYVRVDFSGFEELVNELGGVKIYVDNSFVDTQYPDTNYGYQTISFTKGWQKMDGETALKYARSRHGSNGEGSDFARSQRQQKVIKALKDKALSFSTFMNLKKIGNLMDIYRKNVATNLEPWEIYNLVGIGKKVDNDKISILVLDNHPSSPLYSTMINGAYMLLPKDESLGELKAIAQNVFSPEQHLKKKEKVIVEIQNGTKIAGLATKKSEELQRYGYSVVSIGNASRQNYEKTVIYDLTNGEVPNSLEDLKAKLNANVSTTIPAWLNNPLNQEDVTLKNDLEKSTADFIIILGQDQG